MNPTYKRCVNCLYFRVPLSREPCKTCSKCSNFQDKNDKTGGWASSKTDILEMRVNELEAIVSKMDEALEIIWDKYQYLERAIKLNPDNEKDY